MINPALQIYQPSVTGFIQTGFTIDTLDSNCLFTEGPVWNPSGYYVFSDIPANVIYRISENSGKEIFLRNSGTEYPEDPDLKTDQAGSNALAYDKEGDLLICRHGSHGIARYNDKGLQPFINQFEGRPFNSPNDLILHNNGSIYFSDPPYGLKDGKLNPGKFQPLAGVYCWKNGQLNLLFDGYQYPNGVCLSPDEQLLYICSNKPFEKFITVFDAVNNKYLKTFAEENSDGIECDRSGNVYLCNKDGIIILDREGQKLALISLPTIPANICWGGPEGNDLFITARQNIFLIKGLQK